MTSDHSESYRQFEAFIAGTGGTYVFDGESSVRGVGVLLQVMKDMGLDPMKTEDLRQGFTLLFHLEIVNLPDLQNHRYILAPNHVSDFDALVLGLLHPRIRIVSKNDWTNNARLRGFLDIHYNLYGLDRTSIESLRCLLADSVRYFNESDENRHYLVFSQGTISDFNHNSPERISTIAQKVSCRTGVPVVPVFIEQVSLYHPTRIVFDRPLRLTKRDDFRHIWLERQAALQASLLPPARPPKLSAKHANNNRPGDPYF